MLPWLAVLLGVGAIGFGMSGQQPAALSSHGEGPLAARLLSEWGAEWLTVDVPGARIHLQRGKPAAAEGRALTDLVIETRRKLLGQLGGAPAKPSLATADLFFVSSREDTQRLTGRPLVGFVQSDEPTGVFVYSPAYRMGTLLHHELTHLYAFQSWGATAAGPWLIEGLAVWAAGSCQGHTNDALAAGALARGQLVSVSHLAARFRDIDELVAMAQAGSLVGFLIEREGLSAVQERWRRRSDPRQHPLGPDGANLESAWLARLRGIRPAHADVRRLMREGC